MIDYVLIPALAVAAVGVLILWALFLWNYAIKLPYRFVRRMVAAYQRGEWSWGSPSSTSKSLSESSLPMCAYDSRAFARLNAIRGASTPSASHS